MKKNVYILSAKRTPIGSFGSQLKPLSAIDLGAQAISATLKTAKVSPKRVEEVFMGNVCSAGVGQAPARQAALQAGVSKEAPSTTVNKVCASGMKSIIIGAQALQLGDRDIVIAAGSESMSNIPYYDATTRWGGKFGDKLLIDGLVKDGITDATENTPMGVLAERICIEKKLSRKEQDDYTIESYNRSKKASEEGYFASEIEPIEVITKKGAILVNNDEEYTRADFDKIPKLKPVFNSKGTITAANASTLNDGAAALLMANDSGLIHSGIEPIAKLIGYAETSLDPAHFTLAPILATKMLLERTNKRINEIDLFEINEAFAMVPLLFSKELGVDLNKINVNGGAVALGHPIGCSGARIVVTLIHALKARKNKYGIAAICNGGGGGTAILVEAL